MENAIRIEIKAKNNILLTAQENLGMSSKEFAKYLGINPSTLSSIKNFNLIKKSGQVTIGKNKLKEIIALLGYTVEEVFPEWSHFTADLLNSTTINLDNEVAETIFLQGNTINDAVKHIDAVDLIVDVRRVLDTLNPKQAEIIRMYYGIDYPREYSIDEIGEYLDLTRQRVHQKYQEALHRLAIPARKNLLRKYLTD